MFSELMPMLADRTVMITVARLDASNIQVNFVPKKAKDGENDALTTPLSFTGTPAELDAGMGAEIASYVEAHASLRNTLSQAKASMESVAQAEKDAAEKKKAEAKKKGILPKPEPPKTASMFEDDDATEEKELEVIESK